MKKFLTLIIVVYIFYSPFNCLANQIQVTFKDTEKTQVVAEPVIIKMSIKCIKDSVYIHPDFSSEINHLRPWTEVKFKIIGPDNQTIPPIDMIYVRGMPKMIVPSDFCLLKKGDFYRKELHLYFDSQFPYRLIKKGKYRISAKVIFTTKIWFQRIIKAGYLKDDKDDWSDLEENIDKFADGVYETDEIIVELK